MVFDATELIIIHTSNSMGKRVTGITLYVRPIEVRLLLISVTLARTL